MIGWMKVWKERTWFHSAGRAGPELCHKTPILLLCDATVLNWLPISSQSTVKSHEFIVLVFVKFVIFAASPRTFWGFGGFFFFPTTSAWLLIMQWPLPVSGTILFNSSYKPTVFSSHWLCTVSADINVFIPW